jgi:hypothetical protein
MDQMRDLLNIRFFTDTDRERNVLTLRERPGFLKRAFMVYSTHTVHSEDELTAFLHSIQFNPRTVAVLEEEPHITLAQPVDSVRRHTTTMHSPFMLRRNDRGCLW